MSGVYDQGSILSISVKVLKEIIWIFTAEINDGLVCLNIHSSIIRYRVYFFSYSQISIELYSMTKDHLKEPYLKRNFMALSFKQFIKEFMFLNSIFPWSLDPSISTHVGLTAYPIVSKIENVSKNTVFHQILNIDLVRCTDCGDFY